MHADYSGFVTSERSIDEPTRRPALGSTAEASNQTLSNIWTKRLLRFGTIDRIKQTSQPDGSKTVTSSCVDEPEIVQTVDERFEANAEPGDHERERLGIPSVLVDHLENRELRH